MATIFDVALPFEEVHGVKVYGVSWDALTFLFNRYPPLRAAITGRGITFEQIIEKAPNAMSEIIAAAAGYFETEDWERAIAAAKRVPLDMQADFLAAVVRQTMPGGAGPLAEKIQALAGALNPEDAVASIARSSTRRSKASKNSSPSATPSPAS